MWTVAEALIATQFGRKRDPHLKKVEIYDEKKRPNRDTKEQKKFN